MCASPTTIRAEDTERRSLNVGIGLVERASPTTIRAEDTESGDVMLAGVDVAVLHPQRSELRILKVGLAQSGHR